MPARELFFRLFIFPFADAFRFGCWLFAFRLYGGRFVFSHYGKLLVVLAAAVPLSPFFPLFKREALRDFFKVKMSLLSIHCGHLITDDYSLGFKWLLPFGFVSCFQNMGCKTLILSTWLSNYNIREELAELCASSLLAQSSIWEKFFESLFTTTNSPITDK